MAHALEPRASGPGAVYFELERLEQNGGRLELSGRWFGVRGRRFVRPTLTFDADGQPYRLLADLEHKPWAAEDGSPWTAAFAWAAETDGLQAIELNVAPDITVPLSQDGAGGATRRRRASSGGRADSLRRELQATRQDLLDERRITDRLRSEVAEQREELTSLRSEVDRLREDKVDGDAALARRDAALAKLSEVESLREEDRRALSEAEAERDEVRRARRQAETDRDQALAELQRMRDELELAAEVRDRALSEREGALADRGTALRTRDQALAERDRAFSERDQLAHAEDSLQAQRSAARALVTRRNLSWRSTPWSGAEPNPEILRRHIGWPERIAVISVLIAVLIVLLIVAHVF